MWYTAAILGLAGSLHCAGMCSPLVLAVARVQPFAATKVVYNTGRVLVYGLLGALAASAGSVFNLADYQQAISLVMGVVLLAVALGWWRSFRIPVISDGVAWLTHQVKKPFAHFLQRKSYWATFALGGLNGLLPCGLSLLALTYTFVLPGAREGAFFMVAFGLGTWPVMVGFTALLDRLFHRMAWVRSYAMPIVLVLSAILLIGRGIQAPGSQHHPVAASPAEMPVCMP
ncbi:MAG: sulfite exporter TauE/SafE family protein [Cyclobacteriaceae bacterium]|jgi:sulfite exporter TauE/SafE